MHALLAAALMLQAPAYTADRMDMGDRVLALDRVWLATPAPDRRAAAVPEVSGAVTSFFTQQFGAASRSLDRAIAALEGRQAQPSDALRLRVDPPVVAPGGSAKIDVSWVYAPATSEAITLRFAGNEWKVAPGQSVSAPFTAPASEGTHPLSVELPEGAKRELHIDVVRDLEARLARLPQGDATAEAIRQRLAGRYEAHFPVYRWLRDAEAIAAGGLKDLETLPAMRAGSTVFRGYVPKEAGSEAVVVVALHGAGGSENLFFEGYGAGLAVEEARKRGWVILTPRATAGAPAAVLEWLKNERGIRPKKLFVMGHSMGGGLTLSTGPLKPDAIALFAPAAMAIPQDLAQTPTFLSVGKQEIPMLRTGAQRLSASLTGRANSEYQEVDNSEHLMIVADALPSAFRFFDRIVRP
jgi:predicted esterase